MKRFLSSVSFEVTYKIWKWKEERCLHERDYDDSNSDAAWNTSQYPPVALFIEMSTKVLPSIHRALIGTNEWKGVGIQNRH